MKSKKKKISKKKKLETRDFFSLYKKNTMRERE